MPFKKFPWILVLIGNVALFLVSGLFPNGDGGYFVLCAICFPFSSWFWWRAGRAYARQAVKDQMKLMHKDPQQ